MIPGKTRIQALWYRIWHARLTDMARRPGMVSFTFDDIPLSALNVGGEALEDYGWRGTFYVSGSLVAEQTEFGPMATMEALADYAGRGHEIAHHTFGHLDCDATDKRTFVKDLGENQTVLGAHLSNNFAYPFGSTNIGVQSRIAALFDSCRTVDPGINGVDTDLNALRANAVYSGSDIGPLLALVEQTAKTGGWLIYYTHDVSPAPSQYGCTREYLKQVLDAVKDHGLDVCTVEQARARIS